MSSMSPIIINTGEHFQHLSKAPIGEAILEIRANPSVAWDEDKISSILKEELKNYPHSDSQRGVEQLLQLGLDKPAQAKMKDLGWLGLTFKTEDNLQVAKFHKNSFSFSRLQPYTEWQHFSEEALKLWELYKRIAQPAEIQRLGLRYINRFALPSQVSLDEYFRMPMPTHIGLELPFVNFFHQDTFSVTGHDYAVNVIRATQPVGAGQTRDFYLILDIDVFTMEPIDLVPERIAKRLSEMRWVKNKIFFGSISPSFIEKLI